jgi:hypothetical protein
MVHSHQTSDNRHQTKESGYSPTCSTIVENPLQIGLFMQNKANFRKSQMNVSIFSKMAYENKSNWTLGENKPNQSQFQTWHELIDRTKRVYYYGIW